MNRIITSLAQFILVLVMASTALAGGHTGATKDKDGKWVSPVKETEKGDVIVVAGATGQVGRLIVNQLVGLSQNVRAVVRTEEKARKLLAPTATIIIGDVKKPETLKEAMKGADYVISAVGAGGAKKDPVNNPETVDYKGVVNLVDAAKAAGVKHVILLSSVGVTQPDHFLNKMMHNVLQWKLKGENYLRDSGLPYTIIRPGALSNEPGGKKPIKFVQGDPKGNNGVISRADVTRVIVNAMQDPNAINKTVEITWDKRWKKNPELNGQIDWSAMWSSLEEG